MNTSEFTIHAVMGTSRIYTATCPRQLARRKGTNEQPWGKEYLLNWPYVRYHRQFAIKEVK